MISSQREVLVQSLQLALASDTHTPRVCVRSYGVFEGAGHVLAVLGKLPVSGQVLLASLTALRSNKPISKQSSAYRQPGLCREAC